MIFNYKEEEQLKNKDNKIKYYKQVKPFINGIIWNELISIRNLGNSLVFYSKETRQCLGVSSNITINLFEEVKRQ